MAAPIASYPPTPIHVVVVGAGFGGLTAAIECHLKGHKVTVLERSPSWRQLGDIISLGMCVHPPISPSPSRSVTLYIPAAIPRSRTNLPTGPNAGQILFRYSQDLVADKLRPICMSNDRFRIYTHKGEFLFEQLVANIPGKPMYNGHRAELHRVLFDYATALDIPVLMGKRVSEYKDDEAGAWVVLGTGEVIKGDIIVAADGLRSKAKQVILKTHGLDVGNGEERGLNGVWKERGTGYAVYRAWFDAEECDSTVLLQGPHGDQSVPRHAQEQCVGQ